VHAAKARLVETLGEFDASREWEGHGIQSLGHWGDINLGLPSRLVNELAGVAARSCSGSVGPTPGSTRTTRSPRSGANCGVG